MSDTRLHDRRPHAVLGPAAFLALSSFVALVIGAATVRAPEVGLTLCGLVVLVALANSIANLPATGAVAVVAVWVSGLIDLPKSVHVGSSTALAVLTGLYTVACILVWFGVSPVLSRRIGREFRYLVSFAVWTCLSLSWAGVTQAGVQNVLLYLAFLGLAACAAAWTATDSNAAARIMRYLGVVSAVAIALYLVQVATHGVGSKDLISARGFGLFGIVATSVGMATFRSGRRIGLYLAVASTVAVGLSLSRTASVGCLIVAALAFVDEISVKSLFRTACALAALAALFIATFALYAPFQDRFTNGDVVSVGGAPAVNVSGRIELWTTTWNEFRSSPLWGHGAGSADNLLSDVKGKRAQPHNDYLRLLADFGMIGLLLWLAAYVGLVKSSLQGLRVGGDVSTLSRAAFLSLVGVAIGMATDNVIIYIFVVAPVAVLAGAAAGATMRFRMWDERLPE